MRPAVARTASTLAALAAIAALGAATALAACGSFSAEPTATTDGGGQAPDAAADATVIDGGSPGETCEVLFTTDFPDLNDFEPQSNDAGPATLSKDPAHGVKPPSLAAEGRLVRGTGYLNSSGSRDIVLSDSVQPGERIELAYDLLIEDPIDAYAETGCTLQLFDANGGRTRLLLGLAGTATIQATFDPADTNVKNLTKSVIATRVAGDYRVKTTFAATSATTADVHYEVGDAAVDFTAAPVPARIDRLHLVCGIDYAITDASPPVTLHVWIDDLVVRRCAPKP